MIKAECVGWHPFRLRTPPFSWPWYALHTACTVWAVLILGCILTQTPLSELRSNPKEQILMTHEKTNTSVIEIVLESIARDLMIIPYSFWFELMPNIQLKAY